MSCARGLVWLDAQDRKALRITDGSQRLLMLTEVSMWSNSPRVCVVWWQQGLATNWHRVQE